MFTTNYQSQAPSTTGASYLSVKHISAPSTANPATHESIGKRGLLEFDKRHIGTAALHMLIGAAAMFTITAHADRNGPQLPTALTSNASVALEVGRPIVLQGEKDTEPTYVATLSKELPGSQFFRITFADVKSGKANVIKFRRPSTDISAPVGLAIVGDHNEKFIAVNYDAERAFVQIDRLKAIRDGSEFYPLWFIGETYIERDSDGVRWVSERSKSGSVSCKRESDARSNIFRAVAIASAVEINKQGFQYQIADVRSATGRIGEAVAILSGSAIEVSCKDLLAAIVTASTAHNGVLPEFKVE